MSESVVNLSDPARDLSNAVEILDLQPAADVADRIATACNVTPWSKDFFVCLKIFIEMIDLIHLQICEDKSLDARDLDDLDHEIRRIKELFGANVIKSQWQNVCLPGQPLGPESRTFLKSASRQLRAMHSYGVISDSDRNLITSTIEYIRSDLTGVRLEKSDFAREAILGDNLLVWTKKMCHIMRHEDRNHHRHCSLPH